MISMQSDRARPSGSGARSVLSPKPLFPKHAPHITQTTQAVHAAHASHAPSTTCGSHPPFTNLEHPRMKETATSTEGPVLSVGGGTAQSQRNKLTLNAEANTSASAISNAHAATVAYSACQQTDAISHSSITSTPSAAATSTTVPITPSPTSTSPFPATSTPLTATTNPSSATASITPLTAVITASAAAIATSTSVLSAAITTMTASTSLSPSSSSSSPPPPSPSPSPSSPLQPSSPSQPSSSPSSSPSPSPAAPLSTRTRRRDSFIAGGIAGACGTLTGHPLDTLKVRQQLGPAQHASSVSAGPGVAAEAAGASVLSRVLAGAHSVARLYRGVLPPLLTTGTIRSLNFGIFEYTRREIGSRSGRGGESVACVLGSAMISGGSLTLITSPLVTLKIRQQVHGGSLRECFRERLRAGGIAAFYRGYPLHFACESVGNGAYLLTYHLAKRHIMPDDQTRTPSLPSRILCGSLAGCAGWIFIYPFDVLRSRVISAASSAEVRHLGAISAAVQCYREGGLRAFYRGIQFTLLRAAPVAGVVLPVYDATLRFVAAW